MTKPIAIGYLRRDVSGTRQDWDETRIRSLAARFGYDLCKTLAFDSGTDRPVHRIKVAVSRTRAEAVFVPSADHFDGGEVPGELVQAADVVTVDTEETFARCATGALPELDKGRP